MKQTKTEQRIRRAIEHAAPPMDEILSAAVQRKETVLTMEQRNNHRTIPNSKAKKRRSYRALNVISGLLASAAAVVILFAGVSLVQRGNSVQARITLDVNPSLSISVNNKERVLDVLANNAEATDVIGSMDFAGAQLEVTVNALVGSMLQKGYLDANSNTILVSVEDSDAQHAQALQTRISETINGAFGGNEAAVLSQTIAQTEQTTAEAAQYGISEGKAALIHALMAEDATLSFEALAQLGVQEIALIAESRGLHAAGVRQQGTTADGGYIGKEAAEEIALKHASLAASAVTGLHTELDSEDGTMVYEVEFYADSVEYDYEIDAATGAVRKAKTEGKKATSSVSSAAASEETIGEEKAKSLALTHAGRKEGEVSNLSVKLDRDDGRYEYDVKFTYENTKYEYEIDAVSGEIYKAQKDEKKTSSNTSSSESSTSSGSSSAGSSSDIGKDKAKAIALDHAGAKSGDVSRFEIERDKEDGVVVYEIEFRCDGMEYEYEIDAATGKIRKSSKERDD